MSEPSLVGSRLGKYQIQAEIGRGGMGMVYRGYDPLLDRQVAIKVLAPHLIGEKEFVERFLREARAAARLKHPNIVTIHDVGQEGNWYYFVMEYLQGESLAARLQRQGALPMDAVVTILTSLAAALDYAHQRGVVHRDVKPSNVVFGDEGQVVLTDFGIARAAQESRLTSTGKVMGTPEYMSPEQGQGLKADRRSDVYSLGVILYEMTTGRVPFEAETPIAVVFKHISVPPPRPSKVKPGLPAAVERVILKAMAKAPDDRFQRAGELATALQRAARQPAAPPRRAAPPETKVDRQPKKLPSSVSPPEGRPQPVATALPRTVPESVPVRARLASRRSALWKWIVGGGAALVLVTAVAVIGGVVAMRLMAGDSGAKPTQPTSTSVAVVAMAPTQTPAPTSPEKAAEVEKVVEVASATATLAPTPVPPTATSRPTQTPTSAPMPTVTPVPTRTPTPVPPVAATRPQRIAFVSWRDGNAEIYTMNPDGSDAQRLTHRPGDDWHPSWSPDGQRIAFQSFDKPVGTFNIYVMNGDGSDQHPITYWDKTITGGGVGAQRPVWAPDGQRIAFSFEGADLNAAIYVANADGTQPQQIARGRDPSWSPDGSVIVFEARSENALEIFTVRPDGSGLTQVTSTGENNMYGTWSPNGRYIAYVRQSVEDSAVHVLEMSTGNTRTLVEKGSWGLSWTPDSTRLVYAPSNEGIWVIAVEGLASSQQIAAEGSMPAWSP